MWLLAVFFLAIFIWYLLRENVSHLDAHFSQIKTKMFQDELSEKSLLAAKKDELDAASKQWKARVEKSDAEKFSVAGKMGEKIKDAIPSINLPSPDRVKIKQAKRYKGKDGECQQKSV